MFYNTSTEQSNRMLFMANLMQHLDGDYRFDGLVKEVLKEAQAFSSGRITIYQINRRKYNMVMYLIRLAPDFIRKVDVENMKDEEYLNLLDLMKKGETSPFAQL